MTEQKKSKKGSVKTEETRKASSKRKSKRAIDETTKSDIVMKSSTVHTNDKKRSKAASNANSKKSGFGEFTQAALPRLVSLQDSEPGSVQTSMHTSGGFAGKKKVIIAVIVLTLVIVGVIVGSIAASSASATSALSAVSNSTATTIVPKKEKIRVDIEDKNQGRKGFNYCGDRPVIALTFDDGPVAETELVLKELKEANIKATFFLSPNAKGTNGSAFQCQLVKSILSEGHEVQSHTWSHPNLVQLYTQKTFSAVEDELITALKWTTSCAGELADLVDFDIVRPPYGALTTELGKMLNSKGLSVATWNCDTNDWSGSTTYANVQNRIKQSLSKDKSIIILMHDHSYFTGLIKWVVEYAREQDPSYEFVTMSQCRGACGSDACSSVNGYELYVQ